jgi:hypothetical protein
MMKSFKKIFLVALAGMAVLMAGCGGDAVTTPTTTIGGTSSIKLTLSAGTAPTGTLIGGIEGKITLPPGTSIRTEADSKTVSSEVFVASASALAFAGYTAATGTVNYALVYGTGYPGGNFATLQIDVQKGVTVTAADFALSGSNVIDTAGSTMNIAITAK